MSRTGLTFICDCCGGGSRTEAEVVVRGRKVRFEFTQRFGPVVLDRYGDPKEKQPITENHPFWKPFNTWLAAHRAGA